MSGASNALFSDADLIDRSRTRCRTIGLIKMWANGWLTMFGRRLAAASLPCGPIIIYLRFLRRGETLQMSSKSNARWLKLECLPFRAEIALQLLHCIGASSRCPRRCGHAHNASAACKLVNKNVKYLFSEFLQNITS